MRKQSNFRNLLGITQLEMSILLQVNRSQWAMYESGQRELPIQPFLFLCEIERHFGFDGKITKSPPRPTEPQLKCRQQRLEQSLRDIEYQQRLLARDKAIVEKKQTAHVGLLHLIDFLNSRVDKAGKRENLARQVLESKADLVLGADHATTLKDYEMKEKFLDFQKTQFEAELREIHSQINS